MKLLLGVICVLLSARSFVTSGIKMNEYEGQSVTIECSHVWANGNRKYFCKDPCKEEKDVVADSVKPLHVRYQIQDRGNVFTVTIADLKKTDSGKYWCAVDRMFGDTYTEVSLTVLEALPSSPSLSTRTHIYSPSTISYLGSTSITPNATYTTVTIATNQPTDNNNQTTGERQKTGIEPYITARPRLVYRSLKGGLHRARKSSEGGCVLSRLSSGSCGFA
ncbi:CMRF35-like molecule 1 isoform X2 [Ictalurus furcatus]|uniref:CMRF35-like molecule 1 isoform X2 n=1 Tax=Ictalurus furcatus TaxID=66913 RepID=UPI0023501745|nr:CMRF35-like molecule 1 isoform X2 [Ictalurus furcatus]